MRFPCVLSLLVVWLPGFAMAQTGCVGPDLGVQAGLEGAFEPATDLTPEADADRIAALEQQGWREFSWEVLAAGCLTLDLAVAPGDLPADWPDRDVPAEPARASMHVSTDGEVFRPVENGALLEQGSYLSVLVAQKTETLDDGAVRFFPALWQVTVNGQGAAANMAGPMLRELPPGDNLGCQVTGCGDDGYKSVPVTVADSPDITTQVAPDPARKPDGDGALAAELQTELARVGCYEGTIDGLWGPASRRAMTNFNHWAGKDAAITAPTPRALVTVARTPAPVCGVD